MKRPKNDLTEEVKTLSLEFAKMQGEWKAFKMIVIGLYLPILAEVVIQCFKIFTTKGG